MLAENDIKRYEANQSYVYLIHAIGTYRYCVGHSANPLATLEILKERCPYPLAIAHDFWSPDAAIDEMYLHKTLKDLKVEDQWLETPENERYPTGYGVPERFLMQGSEELRQIANKTSISLNTVTIRPISEVGGTMYHALFSHCTSIQSINDSQNFTKTTIKEMLRISDFDDASFEDIIYGCCSSYLEAVFS